MTSKPSKLTVNIAIERPCPVIDLGTELKMTKDAKVEIHAGYYALVRHVSFHYSHNLEKQEQSDRNC